MEQQQSRSKAFLRIAADFLWPPRSLVSRERGLGKGPLAPHEFGRIHFLNLKRSGRRDGLGTFSGWMAQAGRTLLDEADVIVPVPLHYTRLASRGFNQSAWLADAVSRRTGVPVSVDALKRTRRTPTQGGLSAKARRRNMAGAFAPHPKRTGHVQGKRVLLVDDVLTTGATLSACTRALKRAGARHVDVLVLARVVRETDVTI